MTKIYTIENLKCSLRSTFWHEIGHLVTDIVYKEKIGGISINKFEVNYNSRAIKFKTGGQVLIKKDNEAFEPNYFCSYEFSFYLVILISGCLYQTFYLQSVNKTDYSFNNCFSSNNSSGGQKDYCKFIELTLNKTFFFVDNEQKQQYSIFILDNIKTFIEEGLKINSDFYNGINKVIDQYINIILKTNNKQINKNRDFKYVLKDENLEVFVEKVDKILNESDFKYIILDAVEKIQNKFF